MSILFYPRDVGCWRSDKFGFTNTKYLPDLGHFLNKGGRSTKCFESIEEFNSWFVNDSGNHIKKMPIEYVEDKARHRLAVVNWTCIGWLEEVEK